MRIDVAKLVTFLKPGDRVTTTLGREIVVGSIHLDDKLGGEWWIEPEGVGEFDWWLPVANVIAVNGLPVPEDTD